MTLAMNIKWTFLIGIVLLCFSACQPPTLESIVLPDHEEITCEDYAAHVISGGVLYNNVWNKHAAANAKSRQCLVKRYDGQETQYGWSWRWPESPRTVFAQPQIKIGSSPWDPEPKFGDDLPLRVSELRGLTVAHELDVTSNGNFNIATTMWLTHQSDLSRDSIVAELMIWTYFTPGQFKPGGRKVETFLLNGVEWELWEQLNWSDKSGLNQQEWRHIAFRLATPSSKVEFDVHSLIQRAIDRKSIEPQWYIADLELGTELMGGQGLAWLKQFDVRIVR